MHRGQRHLGGRDHEQIGVGSLNIASANFESWPVDHIVDLRDQHRRRDLDVAVARGAVEEEGRDRAREPRARSAQDRKAAARELGGAFEVEDARAPRRAPNAASASNAKRRRRRPRLRTTTLCSSPAPSGTRSVEHVRNVGEQRVDLLVERRASLAPAARCARRARRSRVAAARLRRRGRRALEIDAVSAFFSALSVSAVVSAARRSRVEVEDAVDEGRRFARGGAPRCATRSGSRRKRLGPAFSAYAFAGGGIATGVCGRRERIQARHGRTASSQAGRGVRRRAAARAARSDRARISPPSRSRRRRSSASGSPRRSGGSSPRRAWPTPIIRPMRARRWTASPCVAADGAQRAPDRRRDADGARAAARPSAPGEAMRIPTGGVVPDGADAVVPVEDSVERDGGASIVPNEQSEAGENITPAGSDMRAGDCVLDAPAGASAGRSWPCWRRSASSRCRSTGGRASRSSRPATNSSMPARSPARGQVRDSNRWAIAGSLIALGCEPVQRAAVDDDPRSAGRRVARRRSAVADAVVAHRRLVGRRARSDPAGDRRSWAKPGVIVHGLRVKPGKPTVFAMLDGKPVIGLPGNPDLVADDPRGGRRADLLAAGRRRRRVARARSRAVAERAVRRARGLDVVRSGRGAIGPGPAAGPSAR